MKNNDNQIIKNSIENYLHECRLNMGQKIREIREKRGYSQDQLAEIMEVNRSTISKIENGKFSFSIDYLSKFSWFLDFDFLLEDNKG
ncbi:XRE family transcriptional regulator [Flavobacterium sp. GSN2]|nr:XRE family transcriptional regulator [Flavobacterium sp. GSN2]